MLNHPEEKEPANVRDYLANERTFLAWVRTSIGTMAFGFVVVKFSLFIKQVSMLLQKEEPRFSHPTGYSAVLGIVLVGVGVLTLILSFIRYSTTNRQLREGKYRHSSLVLTLLTSSILLISILLIAYLIKAA
jgi:putative membrane protein